MKRTAAKTAQTEHQHAACRPRSKRHNRCCGRRCARFPIRCWTGALRPAGRTVASVASQEPFGPVEDPVLASGISGSSLLAMPIGLMPYEATGTPLAARSLLLGGRAFVGPTLPQPLGESRPLIRPDRSSRVLNRIDKTSMIAIRRAHVDATFAQMAASRRQASRARYWLLDESLWEDDLALRNARHRHTDLDRALEDKLVWEE